MNLLSLEGKTALVTGGGRGIGLSIARIFAAHKANIIICGRSNQEVLEATAKNLAAEFSVSVLTSMGDVGIVSSAQDAAKLAFSRFRRLDILVNNAGVLDDALIGMISENSIEDVLTTNVKGVINYTQTCTRLMERSGGGSIINISSIIGRVGNKGQLVYSASKAAVIGATYSAAKELAHKNIRVNAIAPGYIATDMIKHIDPRIDLERRESIAMGRIGEPQDVANTALYLACDLSTYVTGQVIGVDGGMLI